MKINGIKFYVGLDKNNKFIIYPDPDDHLDRNPVTGIMILGGKLNNIKDHIDPDGSGEVKFKEVRIMTEDEVSSKKYVIYVIYDIDSVGFISNVNSLNDKCEFSELFDISKDMNKAMHFNETELNKIVSIIDGHCKYHIFEW